MPSSAAPTPTAVTTTSARGADSGARRATSGYPYPPAAMKIIAVSPPSVRIVATAAIQATTSPVSRARTAPPAARISKTSAAGDNVPVDSPLSSPMAGYPVVSENCVV